VDKSLHDFIKPGIVQFMIYPECMGGGGPVLESIRGLAEDPFFEALEITSITDPDTRRAVVDLCEQARVELIFGAQPILLGGGLDVNNIDEEKRTAAVSAVKGGIDLAHEMGIQSVALLSGAVCDDFEQGKQRLISSLNDLCAYAKPHGINIVLETFDTLTFGKNCLIGPTKDAVEVSEAVRQEFPSFGFMLDLSHLPLIGETSRDAITEAGDHLVHIHIGNCAMDDPDHPAYGDNHPRFGAPGTRNDVPELTEFLRVLLDTGYLNENERKVVSFEVKPMPGEEASAILAGSKRALLDAWRNL
jgi:sugar phosphate isomerase/epimerase